ncbi:MAG: UvrD-helicase domain-containing protein [Clostridia bacterium]|nr:UvrD-helicase domain-containing protein [Clostridia bacterium]
MPQTLGERYLKAKKALFDKAYSNLNPKQREAVFTINTPLLILAGAGSGKTTVLVKRIAYIIKYGNAYAANIIPRGLTEERVAALEGATSLSRGEIEGILPEFITESCPPYNILAITFTNKAAKEIKTRLASELGDEIMAADIWSGTFHSVCMRILRVHGEKLGFGREFTIYDADDTKKAVAAAMKRCNIDEKQFPVKSIVNAISHAKDELMTPMAFARMAQGDFRREKIAKVYAAYQEDMIRSNAMDFDDIIVNTVRLFSEYPDVLAYYQRKFKYVCVDEYQDTNIAQFRLTEMLAGGHDYIMAVGDDDQSIYKFRGATIENILQFDKVYSDAKVIKLEQNYRSTQTILDAANKVIANNVGRRGKNLWTDSGAGEAITVCKTEDQLGESRFIVDTVNSLMASGGYTYRDFAVLYRTNSQSGSVEKAFAKGGVPYRMIAGTRFNDRKEIRDIVAYLQLINNRADRERLLRIINVPARKIGDKTIEAIKIIADEIGESLFYVIDHVERYGALSRSAMTLRAFADLINELAEMAKTAPLGDLFDALADKSGYMRMLEEGGEAEKERIDNILEFKSGMVEYSENTDEPTLTGFLEENALVADVDKYDESADAVVLMTVHSAKGLEFPVVFIPGMEDGIFPGMQNIMGDSEDMEEERRLAYVALTRAKRKVYIIHAKSRLWYGHTVYNPVSRFVSEIPEKLCDVVDKTASSWRTGGMYGGSGTSAPRTYYSAGSGMSAYPPKKTGVGYGDKITVGKPLNVPPQNKDARAQMFALKAGDRVSHITFGEGEILSAKRMGNDTLFEVAFDRAGTKKLMGTYAKLKKI